jgi:hypothetical protein
MATTAVRCLGVTVASNWTGRARHIAPVPSGGHLSGFRSRARQIDRQINLAHGEQAGHQKIIGHMTRRRRATAAAAMGAAAV